ncbi:MAG: hypothetical protein ACP5MX_02925 [Candidatus Micrarchaeia archaeon]
MAKGGIVAGLILLVIIIAALYVAFAPHQAQVSKSSTQQFFFQLVDPPEVPNGTQSLVIAYSSLSAHVVLHNSTYWVSSQSSGSVNLLSVVNTSQVLGSVDIPANAVVDMVRFNITSAKITINNSTYNVTVPSGTVTAKISNARQLNNSASALIDLTPVIATIYTQNSTLFVMVPSVRAIVVGSNASVSKGFGARVAINATERHELEISRPNITLSNVSLSSANNVTSFSITVSNNANSSINIKHIMIFGNESVHVVAQGVAVGISDGHIRIHHGFDNSIDKDAPSGFGASGSFGAGLASGFGNGGMSANISSSMGINSTAANAILGSLNSSEIENIGKAIESNAINITSILNSTRSMNISIKDYQDIMEHINASNSTIAKILNITGAEREHIDMALGAESFRAINFFVGQNGTLVLPFVAGNDMNEFEGEGYTIPAHGSATFSFKGAIGFGNGVMSISLVPGATYKVVVIGEDGARASMNVSAS